MAQDIAAIAPGGLKADKEEILKFVDNLVKSLTGKKLTTNSVEWLIGDLDQALNPSNRSVQQARIAVSDYAHGLKMLGVEHELADKVGADLRKIAPLSKMPDCWHGLDRYGQPK